MTVSETKNDAAMLSIVAIAIGANRRPASPERDRSGTKPK